MPTTEPVELVEPTPTPTVEPATAVPLPTATLAPTTPPDPTAVPVVPTPTVDAEPTPTIEQPTAEPIPTATLADAQRAELIEQRARWEAARPAAYSFLYDIRCDCPLSFWDIRVGEDGSVTLSETAGDLTPPFASIDAIFDHIEQSLDEGIPLFVEFSPSAAGPARYSHGEEPFLGDGEFSLTLARWDSARTSAQIAEQQATYEAARQLWNAQIFTQNYDYTYQRSCFCHPFEQGPYAASVQAGVLSGAIYEGQYSDESEDEAGVSWDEHILTVDEIFDQVERAVAEAGSIEVEYHPTLGYPTNVSIDWNVWLADEEVGYQLSNVRSPDS